MHDPPSRAGHGSVCDRFVCKLPVSSPPDLARQLTS